MTDYERGWKEAINAVADMLHVEAVACIGDIVSGDIVGAKLAHARVGALLTAECDTLEMVDNVLR